jgi:hypothetical protein
VEGLREPTVLQDLFGEANEPIGPDSALAATPALWSHPSHPAHGLGDINLADAQLSQASAHNRSCPGVDLVENDLAVRARSVDLLHV